MSDNQKVALEQAELEFEMFAEAMDLDIDQTSMDDEDRTAFEKHRRRLLRAIQSGALMFNENHEAVYTPQHRNTKHKEALTFHERTGADLMAMDAKKKDQSVSKTYAVMASMCRVHPSTFANMAGSDIKICESIFTLLMD